MRIIHLTPGTGNFHCGSCLRDNTLVKTLRNRGHDAMIVPLYLPLVTDRDAASPEQPVRVGGVSLYLQQKLPWFHRMPRFIHRWLDRPQLLRKAAKSMGMTSAKDLGVMTLGSLAGQHSPQWAEWRRLIAWIKSQPKPDVVSLSNSLLTGLAKAIREETGAAVVCSLQGEDAFLDTLPDPYREQCWEQLGENARHVSLFVSPSRYYAEAMRPRLGVSAEKIAVVLNGIDVTPLPLAKPDPNWPVLGFFARMIHGKGLGALVDAFILLAKNNRVPRIKLRAGGSMTPADEPFVNSLRQKLGEAGLANRAEFQPNLSFDEKVRFFRDVSVFSVPAVHPEAFGLYVIEALACGIPVVQPESGAFPEIIEATGGGILCKPGDPESLAAGIESLIKDASLHQQCASKGRERTRQEFTAAKMAERFEAALAAAVSR